MKDYALLPNTYDDSKLVYLADPKARAARLKNDTNDIPKQIAMLRNYRKERPNPTVASTTESISSIEAPTHEYDAIAENLGISLIRHNGVYSLYEYRKLKTAGKVPRGSRKFYANGFKFADDSINKPSEIAVPEVKEAMAEEVAPAVPLNPLNDTRLSRLERTGRLSVVDASSSYEETVHDKALEDDFYGVSTPTVENRAPEVKEEVPASFKLGEGEKVLDRVIEVNHGSTAGGNIADGTRIVSADFVSRTRELRQKLNDVNRESADLDRQIEEMQREQEKLKLSIARKKEEMDNKNRQKYEEAQSAYDQANNERLSKTAALTRIVEEVERLRKLEATFDSDIDEYSMGQGMKRAA